MADNFDNYGMKVQATASVKMPSVREINKQIDTLEESIKKLRISGQFDDSALKNLTNQLSTLKATVSTANFSSTALSELTSQVEKALGNINISAKVGQELGSAITKGMQQNIDSGVVADIKKISDASTSVVVQNEKKKQEAYKATTETVMYHAGVVSKLNKAETNGRFYGSNRGTGYFGTGHYFVDSATKHELDNNSSYSQMPYTSIDISKYDNLFKASTDEIANRLHSFLENLTKFTQGSDTYDVSELFSQFKKVFGETVMDMQEFDAKLEQLKSFMQNSNMSDRSDSVSTQFMKSLGYGGVDTRGTRYADTRYGTVIYDLKEESILQANITDELQKQGQMLEKINYEKGQVFDQSEDTRIQGILDQQAKSKEIDAEFDKLFDSSKIRQYESELDSVNETLKKNDEIIADCQSGIENADREAQKFAKDMAALGFDTSDEEIAEQADHYRTTFQERIDELQKERPLLEARRQELEENLSTEYKLANTAREQARQIVEERSKEAQESTSTTNTIVQNEEKKQQAIQETVNATKETLSEEEKLADAMGKVREKSELARQAQEKRQEVAQSKAINKALDEEYAQKQKLIAQEEKLAQEQAENVNKIQLLFDNGHGDSTYGNRIKQIENDFVKYGLSVDEASQKTQTLRNILNGFKDTDGNFLPDDKLVAQANKLETEFKAVKVSVDSAKLSYDKFLQPVSSDKASSLIIRINDFLTKNTAITKEAKEELLGFIRLLQNGNVNLSDWNKFDTRLKEINQEMRVAGKLGKSLKQTLIDGAKSFAQWTLSSGAVMEVWNGFKQGIRNVKELDDSLVELNKVTDLTVESLSKVTEESFELGEKLAKTGTKVLDSVTSFSRAGYNIEDSMKYAEEALKTTNISENLKDAGQAADSLVNIMKGFQDETPEFAKKINDSVNQVSNTEAVDFDNLIDGATRLSAVADQAGMSFEQMLGTLTGAYEVLGNMEKVANGQITIFTRLQAIQMEGEEEVSTVAKLQDKFSNATNGAVNIVDKTTGQLRNVYDILDDLSDVWDTLDKNTQEALAFEAAGTRQKNVFLSMMQNWQGVEDAVKSAENSIGSADEENQAYLNSLSGKLEDLESALQHISKTLIDSNLLKFFVDLGTTGVKSVDALIESLSPLGTLLTIGSGIAGAKGLGLTNYVTTIIVYESLFRKRYNNAISPT